MMFRPLVLVAALSALLAGCATGPTSIAGQAPVFPGKTGIQKALNELPLPERPIAVAVYGFSDQTGQFKPSDTGQTLSRAVTQGAGSMLIKSLQEAGQRRWFTVVEREQFKNLLNERQVVLEMRQRYLGETGVNPNALPALLFAGVLLEGGVIGYDTNTRTGGAGAAALGIGANAKYRQDAVTVYLRAVSVKTGEVLTSITSSKTITSVAVDANLFQYVSLDRIAEFEAGFTTNEPGQLALQQAIDKAVYGLVMEGVDLKLWNFADAEAGWPALWRYRQERDGVYSAKEAMEANAADAKKRHAQTAAKPAAALGPTKDQRNSNSKLSGLGGSQPSATPSAKM